MNDLKLIGKGTFSKVYLVKERKSSIFSFDDEYSFVVLKKINVLKLIDKYIKNKKSKSMTDDIKEVNNKLNTENYKLNNPINNPISSFGNNPIIYKIAVHIEKKDEEIMYYKNKIQKLIQSEVDLLSNIKHKNIIKMYNYSIIMNENIFEYVIKFEYMNCGDLHTIKQSEKFEEYRNSFNGFNNEFSEYISKNVLEGLNFLHNFGLIHRDIKLQNILISKRYNSESSKISDFIVKISDFGFACLLSNYSENISFLPDYLINNLQEKASKICGTPFYMAPENILNIENENNENENENKNDNENENENENENDNENENENENKNDNQLDSISSDSIRSFNSIIEEMKKNKENQLKMDIYSFGLSIYELYFNVLPLSNIKNMEEIIEFYKNDYSQKFLNFKISSVSCLSETMKEILFNSLVIDKTKRYSSKDLLKLFDDYNENDDWVLIELFQKKFDKNRTGLIEN